MAINSPTELDLFELTPQQVIDDYRLAYRSRQISLLGRQEVLSGRAKFGIFGDGKEIALVAMAHTFRHGDFRSGYYRDQTLMMALGELTTETFFAQLYAHADPEAEPASAGRMMNAHFVTHSIDADGEWRDLTSQYNSSADVSPTASQMPRLVGLAYASRLYREIEALAAFTKFSRKGNEVAFGTIGNASCAEGMFWEAINAIGVLRAPAVITILDDDYGISVSNEHQITKQNLSELLSGFQREDDGQGYDIYTVRGWDYPALIDAYQSAVRNARADHVPAIIHVIELTQPQGHSTSGSHERYKSEERLNWERERDCLVRMREWMISRDIISAEELDAFEVEDKAKVRKEMKATWRAFVESVDVDRREVHKLIEAVAGQSQHGKRIKAIAKKMLNTAYPKRRDIMEAAFGVLRATREEDTPSRRELVRWYQRHKNIYSELYGSHLYSESRQSPMYLEGVPPVYGDNPKTVRGFEILNAFFDAAMARDPRVIAFGEDVGYLGGVNQTMAGLQAKYGDLRVSDTGIREITIAGQAIGMAMRGLRPIAEIQYLDYLLYALQILSDDLATLQWRTAGRQKAPVIISTRGHRLEGVWHSGSQMAGIINLVRGMHVFVPRDMVRAAGCYNTLLAGDDPGIVVEVLNGYRLKEVMPENLAEIRIAPGMPETLRAGDDITLVTYGAMCQVAMRAARMLDEVGINMEVIDVQSLLPFDVDGHILESLKKTSRIIFTDEDVPGGTTAYMMQQVLEAQGGYHWLDSEPRTLPAKEHRPAYGTDGGYISKPNAEDIFQAAYEMMNEADPGRYPMFY